MLGCASGSRRPRRKPESASFRWSNSPTTTPLTWRAPAPRNRRSSTCSMNPQPGEIWLADLGLAAKTRPVIIVSREGPTPRSLFLYVPRTTERSGSPHEVPLPRLLFLARESVANVQGSGSLPTVRLERRIGRLPVGTMERLEDARAFALDLEHLLNECSAEPAILRVLSLERVVISRIGHRRPRSWPRESVVRFSAMWERPGAASRLPGSDPGLTCTSRSVEEQEFLHWVVFAIPRPKHGAVRDRGCRDESIAQLETMAFSISSQVVSRAPPDCSVGRGARQRAEQCFQAVIFVWTRSRPEFGLVHGREQNQRVGPAQISPLGQNRLVSPSRNLDQNVGIKEDCHRSPSLSNRVPRRRPRTSMHASRSSA